MMAGSWRQWLEAWRGKNAHSPRTEVGLDRCNETTDRRRVVAPSDRLCGITDVGQIRPHNEDAFYLSADGRLLIVADGMGGHNAGEVASALAVEAMVELLGDYSTTTPPASEEAMGQFLVGAFETAHERVLKAAEHQENCDGMGTTLILGYVCRDRLYTCHVGDVRCYVRTGTGLRQITQDHSVVGDLIRAGYLRPEEARRHPRRNEILQAVGLVTGIVPELHTVELASGDQVLLCSDGLWEELEDEEIETVLGRDGSMCQRATQLVDLANAAGGWDNITVVSYEHVSHDLAVPNEIQTVMPSQ